jgi:hypothetical protein
MDYNSYSWSQDQMYLMPPSIREWLPAETISGFSWMLFRSLTFARSDASIVLMDAATFPSGVHHPIVCASQDEF